MRRKVRGTVSGIYMCSAALRRGSKRRHGSALARVACNKTGFVRFFLAAKYSTNRVYHASGSLCKRLRAESSLLISRDNLTMINGSIVKWSRRTLD